MKKVLTLALLVLVPSLAKCDSIDQIVKDAIAQAAPDNAKALPKARIEETSDRTQAKDQETRTKEQGTRTKDCVCGPGCDCPNCQCKPGYKCNGESCKPLAKSRSEAPVERCWVIIDDVKIFTIEDVTPAEAMASIKAQGTKVVFIDRNNTVVDPPSWYSGKVALSHTMAQQRYSGGGVQFIETPPPQYIQQYQQPSRGFGFGAGMNFGRFSAQACVGST